MERASLDLRSRFRRTACLIAGSVALALLLPLLRLPDPTDIRHGTSQTSGAATIQYDDGLKVPIDWYHFTLTTVLDEGVPTQVVCAINPVTAADFTHGEHAVLRKNGVNSPREEANQQIRNAFAALCAAHGCPEVAGQIDPTAPSADDRFTFHTIRIDRYNGLLHWRRGLRVVGILAQLTAGIATLYACTVLVPACYKKRRRRRLKLCLRCGYDLSGTVNICPECGGPGIGAWPPLRPSLWSRIARKRGRVSE